MWFDDLKKFNEEFPTYLNEYRFIINRIIDNKNSYKYDKISSSTNTLHLFNYIELILCDKCLQYNPDWFQENDVQNNIKNKVMGFSNTLLIYAFFYGIIDYNEYIIIESFKNIRSNYSIAHMPNYISKEKYEEFYKNSIDVINHICNKKLNKKECNHQEIEEFKIVIYVLKCCNGHEKTKVNHDYIKKAIAFINNESKKTFFEHFMILIIFHFNINEHEVLSHIIKNINNGNINKGSKRIIHYIKELKTISIFKKIEILNCLLEYNPTLVDNSIMQYIDKLILKWKNEQSKNYYNFLECNSILKSKIFPKIVEFWLQFNSSNIIKFYDWILKTTSSFAWSICEFEKILLSKDVTKNMLTEYYKKYQNAINIREKETIEDCLMKEMIEGIKNEK